MYNNYLQGITDIEEWMAERGLNMGWALLQKIFICLSINQWFDINLLTNKHSDFTAQIARLISNFWFLSSRTAGDDLSKYCFFKFHLKALANFLYFFLFQFEIIKEEIEFLFFRDGFERE